MLWWRSLSPTDKALPARIRQLVETCEDIFERERDAWASTSMVTQKLTTAANSEEGEEEGKKKGNGKRKEA
jgi:hypothetical protein